MDEVEGVKIFPLKEIPSDKGSVLHMLRNDSEAFSKFGEVYFSEVLPKVVKGWKVHNLQTQNFSVPIGKIKLCLIDKREASPTYGSFKELIIGRPNNYILVTIPPGIWYAFSCIGSQVAIICNLTNIPHNPQESEKMDLEVFGHRDINWFEEI